MTEYVAEFPTEEAAAAFVYDRMVITFQLNGDTRFDKWNENQQALPLPRAEEFGGRSIQR